MSYDPRASRWARSRRQAPRGVARAFRSVLLPLLAWCALWLAGAQALRLEFPRLLAGFSRPGRAWSCADPRVRGFPFAFELSCTKPALRDEDGALAAEAASAHGSVSLFHPSVLRVDLGGPMTLFPDGSVVSLSWRRLLAELAFASKATTISAQGLSVRISSPEEPSGEPPQIWRADRLSIHAVPAADPDVDIITVRLEGAHAPEGGGLFDPDSPIEASAAARLDHARMLFADPSAAGLDAWRAAGGTLRIDRSSIGQGGAAIHATGSLGIDPQRRLRGELQLRGSGLSAMMAKLGAPQETMDVTSLLGAILGSGSTGALVLPLSLESGRVAIGPFVTSARLSPLY